MSRAQVRELNKVKLGPAPARAAADEGEDGHDTDDEPESEPSDVGSDSDPVYEVGESSYEDFGLRRCLESCCSICCCLVVDTARVASMS